MRASILTKMYVTHLITYRAARGVSGHNKKVEIQGWIQDFPQGGGGGGANHNPLPGKAGKLFH